MSTTKDRVCTAWSNGKASSAGSMVTAGGKVYSYDLLIGDTIDGELVAFDYTASGGAFKSATTSCHVSAIKAAADRVESVG